MRHDHSIKNAYLLYQFLLLFIAISVRFVCTNNCHIMDHVRVTAAYVPVDCHVCACRLPGMCLLIAMHVPFDCHVCAFCMPEQLPHMGQFCACSLLCMCLLIALSVPVDCHLWACCGPEQLPHMGHLCAC